MVVFPLASAHLDHLNKWTVASEADAERDYDYYSPVSIAPRPQAGTRRILGAYLLLPSQIHLAAPATNLENILHHLI